MSNGFSLSLNGPDSKPEGIVVCLWYTDMNHASIILKVQSTY